jgi:4-hydroxybenzoate polyprenyltransferase
MQLKRRHHWMNIFLWSNHFYGFCAMALACETSFTLLHHSLSLAQLSFIYFGTLFYYTYAYIIASQKSMSSARSAFYQKNKNYLNIRQFFLAAFILYLAFFELKMGAIILALTGTQQFILCSALAVSLLYYSPIKINPIKDLRHWGILKSLSIAWVWVIVTLIIPLLMNSSMEQLGKIFFKFYFIHIFIFILILALLFDTKDVEKDRLQSTKTIALTLGVKKMIQQIIYPLLAFYFFVIVLMANNFSQSFVFVFISSIPIVYLIILCQRIPKLHDVQQNIFFIDGAIFLKTMLGIALTYFYGSHT